MTELDRLQDWLKREEFTPSNLPHRHLVAFERGNHRVVLDFADQDVPVISVLEFIGDAGKSPLIYQVDFPSLLGFHKLALSIQALVG